jgi:hypothetical protein
MDDITITCADCQAPFVFTAGEQQYFADRNYTPPKRCKACRDYRKIERETRAVFRASEQLGG